MQVTRRGVPCSSREHRPAKLEGCNNTAIYMRTAAAGRGRHYWSSLLTGHCTLYGHRMLTMATQLDVMNRLGRAMADPTRSRILLFLLDRPSYPAALADELSLSRTNVSNHLSCLRGCGIVVATPEGRRTATRSPMGTSPGRFPRWSRPCSPSTTAPLAPTRTVTSSVLQLPYLPAAQEIAR